MTDFLKAIFNPAKQATAASGQLGALGGQQGGRFGHLGEEWANLGADNEYKPTDYFDVAQQYDPTDHFDPIQLVKRY